MPVEISIIIPTYKRHSSLERTLKSVIQSMPYSSEIIVVDQSPNCTEKSRFFRKQYPFLKYICLSKPSLPSARNTGVINSSGNIIIFLDDDTTVQANCFKEHITAHSKADTNIVAGRIKQMNKEVSWAQTSMVASIDNKTGETKGNFDLDFEGIVLYATGGHMSVKRKVFKNVGLFNTLFIGNALFEDIEFSLRVKKSGYTIYYNPRAIVCHYPENKGGCHDSISTQYLIERLHNHILFYILHISKFPSKEFVLYIKNLIEYISRITNNYHSLLKIFLCMLFIFKACINARISFLYNPKLTE